jgi:hypothetical protein
MRLDCAAESLLPRDVIPACARINAILVLAARDPHSSAVSGITVATAEEPIHHGIDEIMDYS